MSKGIFLHVSFLSIFLFSPRRFAFLWSLVQVTFRLPCDSAQHFLQSSPYVWVRFISHLGLICPLSSCVSNCKQRMLSLSLSASKMRHHHSSSSCYSYCTFSNMTITFTVYHFSSPSLLFLLLFISSFSPRSLLFLFSFSVSVCSSKMASKTAAVLAVLALLLIATPALAFIEDLCIAPFGSPGPTGSKHNLFDAAFLLGCPFGTDYANTSEDCVAKMADAVFKSSKYGCFSTVNFFSGQLHQSLL